MFAGFNLELTRFQFENNIIELDSFVKYKNIGEQHLKDKKTNYESNIAKYAIDGIINGTKIENDWFPKIDADIFISHSHKDKDLVCALAGWLHSRFDLDCFIDSCVWGYADDLLEKINSDYSDKRMDTDGGYLYNHSKSNTASKHVNTMLTIALHKMIDKSEAVIVINTENSINKYADVFEDSTYSPWIYSEIVCTQIVRNRTLREYRQIETNYKFFNESAETRDELTVAYNVSLEHLININYTILNKWNHNYSACPTVFSLDELYKIVCPSKMVNLDKFYQQHPNIIFG